MLDGRFFFSSLGGDIPVSTVKPWVIAACCLLAAGVLQADDGSGRPPRTPPGVPPQTAATGQLSPADARELAAWARTQSAGQGPLSQDALELEAWARAQDQQQAEKTQRDSPFMYAARQTSRQEPVRGPALGGPGLAPAGQPMRLMTANQPQELPSPDGNKQLQDAEANKDPQAAEPIQSPEDFDAADDRNMLCGNVCGTCCNWCSSGLVMGVESTFLAPYGEAGQAVVLTDLTNGNEYNGSSGQGIGQGIRTWLGMQHCNGFGYRIRYWHFADDEINNEKNLNEPSFIEAFSLQADTFDIEMTQQFCLSNWKLDTSFGGRYARLVRSSSVTGYGTLGNVDLLGFANGSSELEGSGFTFSIAGRKPIACHCGWNWFWSLRGSMLWADTSACVLSETNAAFNSPGGAAQANSRTKSNASSDSQQDVFISEAMLGIQYEKCLPCSPAMCFFRVAVEAQHWGTGDVNASSNSFAFLAGGLPPFGGQAESYGSAGDSSLDLIGLTIGCGLTY